MPIHREDGVSQDARHRRPAWPVPEEFRMRGNIDAESSPDRKEGPIGALEKRNMESLSVRLRVSKHSSRRISSPGILATAVKTVGDVGTVQLRAVICGMSRSPQEILVRCNLESLKSFRGSTVRLPPSHWWIEGSLEKPRLAPLGLGGSGWLDPPPRCLPRIQVKLNSTLRQACVPPTTKTRFESTTGSTSTASFFGHSSKLQPPTG